MKRPDADELILHSAARKVSLQIASACAATVLAVILAVLAFVAHRSQPAESVEHPAGAGRIYIDVNDGLLILILGGVLGIALAAVVGLLSARSAIKPLAAALSRQRRFVQDASHELRTPLAVLDARLQLAERKADAGAPIGDILERLRRDSAALSGIVDDLLLASTEEETPPEQQPVDAAGVAAAIVADLEPLASRSGVRLLAVPADRPRVRIAEQTLRRIISALVENSLAHTPDGGRVSVTVSMTGEKATIEVGDTGHGITGIDRDRIFDRFAHGESSPGESARRSYGIGLALVKETALRHGGDVRVTDTGPGGTIITLTLPAV